MTKQQQQQSFTFRVDSVTLNKLRYIANQHLQTINRELELLVNRHIAEYEKARGTILLPVAKDSANNKS